MFPSESQHKRRRNRKTSCGTCVNIDASVPNSINIQDTRLTDINIAVAVIGMGGKNPIYLPKKFDLDFEKVSNT